MQTITNTVNNATFHQTLFETLIKIKPIFNHGTISHVMISHVMMIIAMISIGNPLTVMNILVMIFLAALNTLKTITIDQTTHFKDKTIPHLHVTIMIIDHHISIIHNNSHNANIHNNNNSNNNHISNNLNANNNHNHSTTPKQL